VADDRFYEFGPFRVDVREGSLMRDGTPVPVTPKAFDTLIVLLQNRGRLVSKEDMLARVWPETFVEDSNLTFNISMLRKALSDGDGTGRYIETVPRRGYRFVAAPNSETGADATTRRRSVGRSRERREIAAAFETVRQRAGLLLCVTGEPGIGKTTLVEEFLEGLAGDPRCRVGRGRCSERLDGTGAYLPLLDALESLCSGRGSADARRALQEHAPSWYGQIVPRGFEATHGGAVTGAPSQERLKRELASFFQDLCQSGPAVLFFDDLQWGDTSTIDLLAYLTGRFDALRLLVIGAYRSSELLLARHPFVTLKLDLQGRGRCRELALAFLTRDDVGEYLALEFPGHRFPEAFLDLVYAKTEGNALFMVDLLRYLRDRGGLIDAVDGWTLEQSVAALERELPESIRSVIQRTMERLDPVDRRLLTAASVQGYEFLSCVAAEAAGLPVTDAEDRLDALDRIHGLVRRSREQDVPDGTCTLRYRFVHVLYQDALYSTLMPGRKAALSAAVAAALQARYGERRGEISSELALLLASARDFPGAAAAFLTAAQHALRLFAAHEAIALATRGLAMLDLMPEGPERDGQELMLQTVLGVATMSTRGFAAPEAEHAYRRALTICQRSGDRVQLFPVLSGLWLYYTIRAELTTSHDLATQLMRLAAPATDDTLVVQANMSLGGTLMDLGRLRDALGHCERALAVWTPGPRANDGLFAFDPPVACPAFIARVLWPHGYPDRALASIETAVARARERGDPQGLAFALTFAAIVSHFRGEVDRTLSHAEEAMGISGEHGLVQMLAWARLWRGWALVQKGRADEGIAEMREGLGVYRAIGSEISRPHFLALLAEALGAQGQVDEGLALLAEALAAVEASGERYIEPEIHRLRGRLLVMQAPGAAPEAIRSIQRALEIARTQEARGWELRAAIELCTLPVAHPEVAAAPLTLAEILQSFTEGFDTRDLRTARELQIGGAV
jgi:DNA-binding winged helix-turn-helix (wHTH) protein/predicted ATPase